MCRRRRLRRHPEDVACDGRGEGFACDGDIADACRTRIHLRDRASVSVRDPERPVPIRDPRGSVAYWGRRRDRHRLRVDLGERAVQAVRYPHPAGCDRDALGSVPHPDGAGGAAGWIHMREETIVDGRHPRPRPVSCDRRGSVTDGDRPSDHGGGCCIDTSDRVVAEVRDPHGVVRSRDGARPVPDTDTCDDPPRGGVDTVDLAGIARDHPDAACAERDAARAPADGDRVDHGVRIRVDLQEGSGLGVREPDGSGARRDPSGRSMDREGSGARVGSRVEQLHTVARERFDALAMTEHRDRDRSNERGRDTDSGDQGRAASAEPLPWRRARSRLRHRLQEVRRVVALRDHFDHSDGILQPLQLDRAAIDVGHAVDLPRQVRDFRAREDLAGTGLTAEAGGKVEGTASVAAPDRHGFARVQADPHRQRQRGVGQRLLHEPCLQVERRPDRLPCGGEDRECLVPTQLDHRTSARRDRLLGQVGELRRQLGRGLVATMVGEDGVPADVRDQEGPDPDVVRGRATCGMFCHETSMSPSATVGGQFAATGYRRHAPGTPFRSCSPRSSKTRPEPATRSRTVRDTSTSDGEANDAIQDPITTVITPVVSGRSRGIGKPAHVQRPTRSP